MEEVNITKQELQVFAERMECIFHNALEEMEGRFHQILHRQNEIYEHTIQQIGERQDANNRRFFELTDRLSEISERTILRISEMQETNNRRILEMAEEAILSIKSHDEEMKEVYIKQSNISIKEREKLMMIARDEMKCTFSEALHYLLDELKKLFEKQRS